MISGEEWKTRSAFLNLFPSWLLLPTPCRYRGLLSHLITLSDTYTIGRTPLDEGSAVAEAYTCTRHNIHKRRTSMPPTGFESVIPISERPLTDALDKHLFKLFGIED